MSNRFSTVVRELLVCGLGCVLAMGLAARPAAADAAPARAVVAQLQEAMAGTLRDAATLGFQGRFDRLDPALRATFDLPFMAEKSLGRHWAGMAEGDRERWLRVFETYTIATYASRLDKFAEQKFEILGDEPGGRDTVAVRTRISPEGEDPVDLTYRLRETPAGWRIVDIYLKGTVSELAIRRSDYAAVLRDGGLPALLSNIEGKIVALGAAVPSATP